MEEVFIVKKDEFFGGNNIEFKYLKY